MKYKNIKSPSLEAYEFVNRVNETLDRSLKRNLINYKSDFFFTPNNEKDKGIMLDGYFNSGEIINLFGHTALEIKYFSNTISYNELRSLVNKFENTDGIDSLLLITNVSIPKLYEKKLQGYIQENKIKLKTMFLTYEKLKVYLSKLDDNKILKQKKINLIRRRNNVSTKELKKFKLKTLFETNNEININNLISTMNHEYVTLFLGAGVSKDYGLPTWNEIIAELSQSILESNEKLSSDECDVLKNELSVLMDNNPLIAATYLETGFKKNNTKKSILEFTDLMHSILYKEFIGIPINNINQNGNLTGRKKSLEIIAEKISDNGNCGIKKVITYNYDDLLEQVLEVKRPNLNFQVIFDEMPVDRNIFSINHVHGFLPLNFSKKKYPNYDRTNQELIFTESSYMSLQSEPYSWKNLSQVNSLKEENVLIIGMSLADTNLRKLLHITNKYISKNHFILLEKPTIRSTTISSIGKANSDDFLEMHINILTDNFKKLGLTVIWYKNLDDLSEILSKLS